MDTAFAFEIEDIPVSALLYYRIHKTKIDPDEPHEKRKIMPMAFDPQPQGSTQMSTDWNKYATPEESRNRAKVPSDNGIVSFLVERINNAPYPLNVKHDPVLSEPFSNKAHTIVYDVPPRKKNDIGLRMKLRDICNWEIHIGG